MPQSDVKLVQKALAGDLDAFGQLVGKYQDAVYGLAYHLVGNFADAQDLEDIIESAKSNARLRLSGEEEEIQRYVKLAAEHLAILEDIHIRRIDDLEPLTQKYKHKFIDETPIATKCQRLAEHWRNFIGKTAEFRGHTLSKADWRTLDELSTKIVPDVHYGREILGLWEVFASFRKLPKSEMKKIQKLPFCRSRLFHNHKSRNLTAFDTKQNSTFQILHCVLKFRYIADSLSFNFSYEVIDLQVRFVRPTIGLD